MKSWRRKPGIGKASENIVRCGILNMAAKAGSLLIYIKREFAA
jgi:hypothetical protein